jgi:hypothetical protein
MKRSKPKTNPLKKPLVKSESTLSSLSPVTTDAEKVWVTASVFRILPRGLTNLADDEARNSGRTGNE